MQTPAASPLESLVGERTVPDLWHENYWFRRHEAAYVRLAPLLVTAATGGVAPGAGEGSGDDEAAAAGVVLEAGAGEGYGVEVLRAAGAGRVVALDYDGAAVVHAAGRYPRAAWVRGNLARLPFAAGSVAGIASFQTIEHLWTPWEFLTDCARVLRPGAPLVVTTPNRPVFSPGLARGESPPNPFHVREYDAQELHATIAAHLQVAAVLGLVHGERLRAWEAAHGDVISAQLAQPPTEWPANLRDLVRSVTVADFDLVSLGETAPPTHHLAESLAPEAGIPVHDLIVIARAATR